jgi:hypothetical protein
MAERITRYHPIGLEGFQSIWMNNFEIWNLYVKNIIFAYSLPISTSTWHSNHRNGPGGYMSGKLKSENIKYRKDPTRRSHYPATRPIIILLHTTKHQKDIRTLYSTILQYSKDPQDYKTIQPRPSSMNKTLIDCCSYMNTISINDLECSLRYAGEYKIITHYYSLTSRESPREVINSLHWNYYFLFLPFRHFELPYCRS